MVKMKKFKFLKIKWKPTTRSPIGKNFVGEVKPRTVIHRFSAGSKKDVRIMIKKDFPKFKLKG